MYANILLSTDGSDVARKGVEHGIALAKALNAKVTPSHSAHEICVHGSISVRRTTGTLIR